MLAKPVENLIDDPGHGFDIEKLKFNKVSAGATNNIVHKEALRKVQLLTLDTIEKSLQCTFGPAASSTVILTGSDATTLVANYSKDGRKCLKHLMFNNPIELSIRTQLDDIVSHVDQEVGDGTTSATLLSAEIFKQLCATEEEKGKARYPYVVSRTFKKAVEKIQEEILTHKRELTLEDVRKIAYISTNGNDEIADMIYNVYKEFGLDCYIETAISNTEDNQVKIYDGLTLDEGYSDAAYINTSDGKASIRNAHVYVFQDPIDTPEMGVFLDKIIKDNIILPVMNSEMDDIVPTVILAPKISRDMTQTIAQLVEYLYQYDARGDLASKPPILIVTNLGAYLDQYLDIGRLCGATNIKKYIDPEIQKQEIEKGLAPTPDTVHKFAGSCELVEANIGATKFVNPERMFEKDETGTLKCDENGEHIPTPVLSNLLAFLESQIEDSIKNNEDDRTISRLKKRLQSLKANMIELEIGGITIADRDEAKDLVDDAVKSCRSAAISGVGYGANFEGFRACSDLLSKEKQMDPSETPIYEMIEVIFKAYVSVLHKLYESVITDEDIITDKIKESLNQQKPFNIVTDKFDDSVLTSIDTDVKILDAISKIVTLMFTTEQCYVQVPALNHYTD